MKSWMVPAFSLGVLLSPAMSQTAKLQKPLKHQLYPRDAQNKCTVVYETMGKGSGDEIVLQVYADKVLKSTSAKPDANGSTRLSFSASIDAKLTEYDFVLSRKSGNTLTPLERADSVVCGDAYIVAGQSNANATKGGNISGSEWVRGFGPNNMKEGAQLEDGDRWALARGEADGSKDFFRVGQVGYWGYVLGDTLSKTHKIPVAIILAAAGGTPLEKFLKDYPVSGKGADTINLFGGLVREVQAAGLANAVKALIGHQGENDQSPAFAKLYLERFKALAADWRKSIPGIKKIYVWQIRPNACPGDTKGHSIVREAQRRIPSQVPDAHLMSSIGAEYLYEKGDQCHYLGLGYEKLARLIYPLLARDFYGVSYTQPVTPPNILAAGYAKGSKTEIQLKFDQDVEWENDLSTNRLNIYKTVLEKASQQYLKDWIVFDDSTVKVSSGSASGSILKLTLNKAATVKTVTYVPHHMYPGKNLIFMGPLIWGKNNIAALTFDQFPVGDTLAIPASSENGLAEIRPRDLKVEGGDGNLAIRLGQGIGEAVTVKLVNIKGQPVHLREYPAAPTLVPVPALHSGVYFLEVQGKGFRQQGKLVVP